MARSTKTPFLTTSPFDVDTATALSPEDTKFLKERERIIERGQITFLEVGKALIEIRHYGDGKLYKSSYGTFEAYVGERWGFGRAHAYRLITSAEVVADLSPRGDIPPPTNEKQIRELTRLKRPEDRQEAWKNAVANAREDEITAA